jgi:rRNA maturation protein Nop10
MKSQSQRTLLFSFLASIATCGALGVYCLLLGNLGQTEAKILGSTALIGAASILGLVGVMSWEHRRWHPLGLIGVCLAAFALASTLIMIWSRDLGLPFLENTEEFWKLVGIAWVLAIACPHISLLSFARLHAHYLWIRRATIIAITLLAGLVILFIITEGDGGELLIRLIGILAIADVCGTLAMPILHRVSSIRTREAVRTVELRVTLTCPRCDLAQTLAVGRSSCTGCGLRFAIEIEEDLCEKCGYPLYRLESAVCPECGTSIARPAPTKNSSESTHA